MEIRIENEEGRNREKRMEGNSDGKVRKLRRKKVMQNKKKIKEQRYNLAGRVLNMKRRTKWKLRQIAKEEMKRKPV